MDIHPVCNMGVGAHVVELIGGGEACGVPGCLSSSGRGFAPLKPCSHPSTGGFCHDDSPTMADFCLVPQVYNAERWGVDLKDMPRIRAIVSACVELPAFRAVHPVR